MPIPAFQSIVNIAYVSGVTRSGQVFVVAAAPKRTEDAMIKRSNSVKTPVVQVVQSRIINQNVDQDEVLKLIKKSDSMWWTSYCILRPRYMGYTY